MSNTKHIDYTDYCSEIVLKHDRERLFCVMLSPLPLRPALAALLAWNVEIAKTGEVASEEMIGLIRLQWWREALDEIYAGKPPRQHAVVLALAEAIREHGLPQEPFAEIITAREADLERAPFATLDALDAYSLPTGGNLLKLWLRVLGVDNRHAAEAAEHVGAAWAQVGILRASHHLAHQGKVRLPQEALGGAGIDADHILQKGFSEPVSEAVQAVAELAEEHIRDARALWRDVPRAALPPLYLAVLAEDYLSRLRQCDYQPDQRVEKGRAKRAIKLWWASLRRRY